MPSQLFFIISQMRKPRPGKDERQLAVTRSPDPDPVLGFSFTDVSAEATLESVAGFQLSCYFMAHTISDFTSVIIFMQELSVRGGQFGKLVYLPLQELYKSDFLMFIKTTFNGCL